MGNIVKWYDPQSNYAPAQTVRLIAVDFTPEKDALLLRAAKPTDPEGNLFDPTTELAALWETLKHEKHNVYAPNLFLSGAQIDPNTGNGVAIEAAIRNEKKPQYGYAFKPEQLRKHEPLHFFMGANIAMHGIPWFSCSVLPYQGRKRSGGNGRPPRVMPVITRMTPMPTTPQITRRGGKS